MCVFYGPTLLHGFALRDMRICVTYIHVYIYMYLYVTIYDNIYLFDLNPSVLGQFTTYALEFLLQVGCLLY